MRTNKIKLTESQLHNVIKESVKRVLKEIRLGDVELHGNNPEDWMAMSHVRRPYSMIDKSRRNLENARSLVDKEFSDFMTQPGHYTFPDVETKDKAQDRLSQIFNKGHEKASSIEDSLRKINAKQVEQMIRNAETFYVQRLQSNGYYPIYKLEYDEESGDYIEYRLGFREWKRISRFDSAHSLMYYLKHNACAISKNDFGKNTKQYPGSEDCVEIF